MNQRYLEKVLPLTIANDVAEIESKLVLGTKSTNNLQFAAEYSQSSYETVLQTQD